MKAKSINFASIIGLLPFIIFSILIYLEPVLPECWLTINYKMALQIYSLLQLSFLAGTNLGIMVGKEKVNNMMVIYSFALLILTWLSPALKDFYYIITSHILLYAVTWLIDYKALKEEHLTWYLKLRTNIIFAIIIILCLLLVVSV